MESTESSLEQPQLPPGFRFHPTDEELVVHYLKKKKAATPLPVAIIAEVDLYKFDPWELPAKAIFGEKEWYFFSPRDRKYPNGARPNRAATSGYWKATGTDKPVLTAGGTQKVGVKKALVFYGGKPPKGIKTNWIMHEFRLVDNNKPTSKPPGCDFINKKASSRLDDWVLCRIYKKNTTTQRPMDQDRGDIINDMNNITSNIPPSLSMHPMGQNDQNLYQGIMNNNSHSCSSGSTQQHLQIMTHNLLPTKRALPNLYWNDENSANNNSPVSMKRSLLSENCIAGRTDETTNSIGTILGHQAMVGNLGDGVFGQQPYMHWYT